MIDSSKKTIGLYPTEKIGFNSIVSICPANRLDILITDWNASEEDLAAFDKLGIELMIVEKEDENKEQEKYDDGEEVIQEEEKEVDKE